MKDFSNKSCGIIGIEDTTNNVAIYVQQSLISVFDALFDKSLEFEYFEKEDNIIIKEKANPKVNADIWISELRRQMPTPLWGKRPIHTVGNLITGLRMYWKEHNADNDAEMTYKVYQ